MSLHSRTRFLSTLAVVLTLLAGIASGGPQGESALEAPATEASTTEPTPKTFELDPELPTKWLQSTRARAFAVQRVEQVRANLEAVRDVLEIGLSGDEAGELLREAWRRAPELAAVELSVRTSERELAHARLNRVKLLQQRRLSEDDAEIASLSDDLGTLNAYVESLESALAAQRELSSEATTLIELLDSRLLWIASARPIDAPWMSDVTAGVTWFLDPRNWIEVGATLLRRCLQRPFLVALLSIACLLSVVGRRHAKRWLVSLADDVDKFSRDSFLVTLYALGSTVLVALTVPLIIVSVGLLLVSGSAEMFARALAQGLFAAAAVLLLLEFFRQMCRPSGLANAHFHWNERARRILQVNLRWLILVEVAAALLVSMCDASEVEAYEHGLGRLMFMVGSVALTLFVARIFLPDRGALSELLSRDGWTWRLRKLWYALLVLLPGTLVIAAAVGYYFTATEIQSRFFSTGLVVLAGIVAYSVLKRWLIVTRRRLAVLQARERLSQQREARLRQGSAEALPTAPSGEAMPDLETKTIDVTAASAQTLSLLRVLVTAGVLAWLWAVWKDVLPALTVLERIELSDPALDASGAVLSEPVTAWSLLLASFAAMLTILAARNLPAVLELAVLQRFSLDSGTRYAAVTLTRYAVLATGVVVVSQYIGIDWSRAQWIIAALGVGLGFGLQEIVANFVSGLIILFERPVRVGDTVTVGEDSGTVSKLQIRATTITDWNNKEILVPNKNFITGRVVNWTLSSPVTRLLLPIGVAYGTDEVLAQRVIAEAVREVPAVLSEPGFSVLFVGFGESSLNFEVRAFVAELGHRLPTLHELNLSISNALRDAGIEIPFPQRDLHLRSSDIGGLEPPLAPDAAD